MMPARHRCLVTAARSDELGARSLAQLTCMFVASIHNSTLKYLHLPTFCSVSTNPTCLSINTTIKLAKPAAVHDHDADSYFAFNSCGEQPCYRTVAAPMKLLRGPKRGYSGKYGGWWGDVSLNETIWSQGSTLAAFDHSKCPHDGTSVMLMLDGTGCSSEFFRVLSRSTAAVVKEWHSFRGQLQERLRAGAAATGHLDPGFKPGDINVVLHWRLRDAPLCRRWPAEHLERTINMLRAVLAAKRRFSARFWLHTDGCAGADTCSLLQRRIGQQQRNDTVVLGRDFGLLRALTQFLRADILLPAPSSLSIFAALLTQAKAVLFPEANPLGVQWCRAAAAYFPNSSSRWAARLGWMPIQSSALNYSGESAWMPTLRVADFERLSAFGETRMTSTTV